MSALSFDRFSGLADRGGAIVVKKFPEELQNSRLANTVIIQNASDFAFDVLASFQFPFGQCRSQMVVFWANIRESRIDREGEFVPLQRYTTILVRLPVFAEFRAKERIAIKKNRHQPDKDALILSKFLDGFVGNFQINGGLRLTRRAKR